VRVTHIVESKFELWIGLERHDVFSWGVAWLNDIRMYNKAFDNTNLNSEAWSKKIMKLFVLQLRFLLLSPSSHLNFIDMKKQIIAILVGGLILFIWQFVSWAAIPIHKSEYGYTPNQDKILEALAQNLPEEGTYHLPYPAPGTSHEQAEAEMIARMDKPWASVSYHKSMNTNMGMNMFRGFAIDLVSIFLLCWLFMKFQTLNMNTAVQASVAVGIIGYLTIPYLHSIWFQNGSIEHLIDAVVQWGLVGVWLGWWLPRK
jgi:hypothetical protein